MRAQTEEEWERELIGIIEDVSRKEAPNPVKALRLALGASGVRQPQVVWQKRSNEGPVLPFSAKGFVREISGTQHQFKVNFTPEPLAFRWVD